MTLRPTVDFCELLWGLGVTCSRLNDAAWQYAALRHEQLWAGTLVVVLFLVPVAVAVWWWRA